MDNKEGQEGRNGREKERKGEGKVAQTSTEREMEEPCGKGRQEKVGSTASGCRG